METVGNPGGILIAATAEAPVEREAASEAGSFSSFIAKRSGGKRLLERGRKKHARRVDLRPTREKADHFWP